MASAFALTLAYLGEQCSSMDAGGAFAAYITGNVASNLIGRLVSAARRRYARAGIELLLLCAAQSRRRGAGVFHHPPRPADACDAGGAIALRGDDRRTGAIHSCAPPSASASASCSPSSARSPSSISSWCAPPLSLGRMDLGFVYFVFAAFRRDDAVCRQGRGAFRHAADDLGCACGCRARPAADAVCASSRTS